MRKLKVLIGSAGSVFCDITKAALELWGCAVTVIPDGKQMCATLLSSQVDICFLDWDLPKMSGPETCKWIRAVEAKKQPYIVLVTERNRVEQVRAAYIAGANDYLASPFNLEELRSLVLAFAQKISQQDIVSNECTEIDPLELYRRDLSSLRISPLSKIPRA
jgi:sigma-B regulation protein RsbU (phosphoserine phosphatase)